MLQIQHQPKPQVQPAQTGPTQNPLLFLSQQQPSSPPPTSVFSSSSMFDRPTTSILQSKPQHSLPSQPTSVSLQHGLWHQGHELSSSGCSSSLSPVASAAYLLEARLHISQQPHQYPHTGFQHQLQTATQCTFPIMTKPAMWNMGSASNTDPNMQELCLAGQQQLSSCVMVKWSFTSRQCDCSLRVRCSEQKCLDFETKEYIAELKTKNKKRRCKWQIHT